MTRPTSTDQAHDGDTVENFVIDAAAPQLAAIQQGYEEARASIIDPTREPLNWVHDPADPYPATEAIDVDAVPPPLPTARPPQSSTLRATPFGLLRRCWRAFWTP